MREADSPKGDLDHKQIQSPGVPRRIKLSVPAGQLQGTAGQGVKQLERELGNYLEIAHHQ